MKKAISLVLCLVLVGTLILGSATALAAEGSELSGKIVVGGWPVGDKAFEAILAGFNEKYPNIEVELDFQQSGDYNQLLGASLAAGTGAPDVAMIEQLWVGRYKDTDRFVNLLDAPYNAGALKDDFVEYKWNSAVSSDGERLTALVWDIGPASTFYRRDVFESVGLSADPAEVEKLLSTWEGVLEAAEKVYVPNERWLIPNAFYLFSWFFVNRDYYSIQDGELVLNLEKPGVREALEAAITMRKNGWDAQIPMGARAAEFRPAFFGGQLAFSVSGCWFGGSIKSLAPETSGLWGVSRLPGSIPDSNWGGSYVGIPAQSENKELAWAFIEYAMATKEGQNGMFQAVDYFPGYKPAWDDPLYNEPDAFFADQPVKNLWVDISKAIQPMFSTQMDNATEELVFTAVDAALNQFDNVDDILEYTRKEVMAGIKQDFENTVEALKEAGLLN